MTVDPDARPVDVFHEACGVLHPEGACVLEVDPFADDAFERELRRDPDGIEA